MGKLLTLKKSKKGFTLVEIIVVLVILAILAAIAIPSLVGYIDKAKGEQVVTEARTVYVAAQAYSSEQYAASKDDTTIAGGITTAALATTGDLGKLIGEQLTGTIGSVTVTSGKVTGFTYTKDGKTATYSSTGFTVAKASSASTGS